MEILIWDGKDDVLINILFVLYLFPSLSPILGHCAYLDGKAKPSATRLKSINNQQFSLFT